MVGGWQQQGLPQNRQQHGDASEKWCGKALQILTVAVDCAPAETAAAECPGLPTVIHLNLSD